MEKEGIISKSLSLWALPIVIVAKKNESLRYCIDYRKLNKIIKTDAHPLPRIDDLLEQFREAKWFTTFDLASRYWQVEMNEEDIEKTAFITQFGLFQFNVMPFGLKNAPALFQRMMNHILQEYLDDLVAVYLDDIIIYSKIFEEHIKHITKVLEKLREANLIIKLRKCKFFEVEISFLEHIVRRYGLKPV